VTIPYAPKRGLTADTILADEVELSIAADPIDAETDGQCRGFPVAICGDILIRRRGDRLDVSRRDAKEVGIIGGGKLKLSALLISL